MESAKFDHNTIDNWWILLKDLNVDSRIELATRLINSLKPNQDNEKSNEEWTKLFGSWASDSKSAEDMINEIKTSRFSNREIEPLD